MKNEYLDLCRRINIALSDKIIKESFDFKMPHRMGALSIRKGKLNICVKDGKLEKGKLIIDWGKSWAYWKEQYPGKTRKEINEIKDKVVIYNMNDHTNGYVMRWKWDKSTCNLPNHTVYQFRPTKQNRLTLAAWINNDERTNDYYLSKHYGVKSYKQLVKKEEI